MRSAQGAAARTKATSLSARYQELARCQGRKRAITALAHTILKIMDHMLREGMDYRERP